MPSCRGAEEVDGTAERQLEELGPQVDDSRGQEAAKSNGSYWCQPARDSNEHKRAGNSERGKADRGEREGKDKGEAAVRGKGGSKEE